MQSKKIFKEINDKGYVENYEMIAKKKDGSPIHILCSNLIRRNKEGNLLQAEAFISDITERKKAEEDIENLARFPSENPNPVLRIAKNGVILYANAATRPLLTEWKREVGQPLPDSFRQMATTAFTSGSSFRFELEHLDRIFSFEISPVKNADYVNAYGRDITERKKIEKSLVASLEKVQSLNEKLNVIGGLTRHDVNNKLATIRANAYLTKQGLIDDHQVLQYLREIELAVRQAELIFDFARFYEMLGIETLEYVRVEDAVKGACKQFSDLRVAVVNDCGGLRVLADSLLSRLFYNLIDNSLKHGEKVTKIRVYHEELGDKLHLVYEDDGVGIPPSRERKNLRAKLRLVHGVRSIPDQENV